MEQLSPGATSTEHHVPQPTEPWCMESVLCNRRGQGSETPWTPQIEAPALRDWREPVYHNEDPLQPKININKLI